MELYKVIEPSPNGTILHYYTREGAIKIAKAVAKERGYIYKSDEEALQDFVVVHWAEKVDNSIKGLEITKTFIDECMEIK